MKHTLDISSARALGAPTAARIALALPASLVINDLPLPVVRQALDDAGLLPRQLKANKEERPIRDAGRLAMSGEKRDIFTPALQRRLAEFET